MDVSSHDKIISVTQLVTGSVNQKVKVKVRLFFLPN